MPGPIGAAVNRVAYYAKVAKDRAAANEKNKDLIASQVKAEPLEFVKEVPNQLGSLFNRV